MNNDPINVYCLEKIVQDWHEDTPYYVSCGFEFFIDECEYSKRLNELERDWDCVKIHKYIANKIE